MQPRNSRPSTTKQRATRSRSTSSAASSPRAAKAPRSSEPSPPPSRTLTFAAEPSATSASPEARTCAPKLVATYQNNADPETKKAAVEALFLANDAHDLVTLAKAEKDPALKQNIIQQLSIMHSPEATAYMLEILNK